MLHKQEDTKIQEIQGTDRQENEALIENGVVGAKRAHETESLDLDKEVPSVTSTIELALVHVDPNLSG